MILFRYNKEELFNNFINDVLPRIEIVTLSNTSYGKLSEFRKNFGLDFDDSYQCMIAAENRITVVTMDKDFKRIEDEINVRFI